MPSLSEDIKKLNLSALMLARETAKTDPLAAIYRFGMTGEQANGLIAMSLQRLEEIASCGRLIFASIPTDTPTNISASLHMALLPAGASNDG